MTTFSQSDANAWPPEISAATAIDAPINVFMFTPFFEFIFMADVSSAKHFRSVLKQSTFSKCTN